MISFLKFIGALRELFKLWKAIEKAIAEAKVDRKVVQDVKTIHEAFDAKDPDKLRALFNS